MEINKHEWYSKLLAKLKKIESGEMSLTYYISEIEEKLRQPLVSGSLPLPTKEEILAEAESIYKECNTSNEAEAVRQAGTAKLMFIAGAWFSRGFKRQ